MNGPAERRDRFAALVREHLADPEHLPLVVELIQRGLVHAGHDLGDFGPAGDGVDRDPGEVTVSAFIAAMQAGERSPSGPISLDDLAAALAAVAPTLHDSERDEWVGYLDAAAKRWGIDTRERLAMWLAQLGHESAGFTRLEENLNYSADGLMQTFRKRIGDRATAERLARKPEAIANHVYGNREDLGNDRPGDGWRYQGRGWIQITGAFNYREAGRALGLDLENVPSLAALPEHAAQIAGWYWSRHGLNRYADAGDIWGCTRRITGAPDTAAHKESTGLPSRRRLWTAAKAALGVERV